MNLEKWIKKNKWQFIHPLKMYVHQNREVYKSIEQLEIMYNKTNLKLEL